MEAAIFRHVVEQVWYFKIGRGSQSTRRRQGILCCDSEKKWQKSDINITSSALLYPLSANYKCRVRDAENACLSTRRTGSGLDLDFANSILGRLTNTRRIQEHIERRYHLLYEVKSWQNIAYSRFSCSALQCSSEKLSLPPECILRHQNGKDPRIWRTFARRHIF